MMNYNKKEQLLDKVDGLRFLESGQHMFWYNKAIYSACKRIEEFFDAEFIPEVPQYVADWYEEHKDELEFSVFHYVYNVDKEEESAFKRWFVDSTTKPFQLLFNMQQFGYKIKEEKKYTVRMIGLEKDESYLKYNVKSDFWYLGTNETYKNTRVKHTIEELEKSGFKEVFPSPLFEIVEVKE